MRDHGRGIAPEHLPRLTERFYRVDPGQSRAKNGTGLGLAIVKHILARHRGRLPIASRLGQGSTFTALRAARHPDKNVLGAKPERSPAFALSSTPSPPLSYRSLRRPPISRGRRDRRAGRAPSRLGQTQEAFMFLKTLIGAAARRGQRDPGFGRRHFRRRGDLSLPDLRQMGGHL